MQRCDITLETTFQSLPDPVADAACFYVDGEVLIHKRRDQNKNKRIGTEVHQIVVQKLNTNGIAQMNEILSHAYTYTR